MRRNDARLLLKAAIRRIPVLCVFRDAYLLRGRFCGEPRKSRQIYFQFL